MAVGLAPGEAGPEFVQVPFGDPGGLGLVALFGQAPDGINAVLLDGEHGIDQARRVGEAVGGGEHLEAVTPVGRLRVS